MKKKTLTPKQQKFVDEYLIDLNATQAAIRAGYSRKTANAIAGQNLQKPVIAEYIQIKREEMSKKSDITKEALLAELKKIAFFDIRKIYTVDSGLKNVQDFDDDEAAAIAGIDTYDVKEPESGMILGTTQKVKIQSKIAAIERIAKMLGYDAPQKLEHSGSLDFKTFLMRNNKVKK